MIAARALHTGHTFVLAVPEGEGLNAARRFAASPRREVIFDERLVHRKRCLRTFGSSHDGELHKTGGVARARRAGMSVASYVPVIFTALCE